MLWSEIKCPMTSLLWAHNACLTFGRALAFDIRRQILSWSGVSAEIWFEMKKHNPAHRTRYRYTVCRQGLQPRHPYSPICLSLENLQPAPNPHRLTQAMWSLMSMLISTAYHQLLFPHTHSRHTLASKILLCPCYQSHIFQSPSTFSYFQIK